MVIQNDNLVVLLDTAFQKRRMRHYLKSNGIPILKQGKTDNGFPVYYMLSKTEHDCFVKITESVTWHDAEGMKHSLFDNNMPYTDVVTWELFLEEGGWVSCEEV